MFIYLSKVAVHITKTSNTQTKHRKNNDLIQEFNKFMSSFLLSIRKQSHNSTQHLLLSLLSFFKVATLRDNCFVGEQEIIHNRNRDFTAVVTEDTLVYTISKRVIPIFGI